MSVIAFAARRPLATRVATSAPVAFLWLFFAVANFENWRATHRPPALPAMPAWQTRAAHINHWVLYTCLFLQPLSGYVGSAVSGYPVRYFGMLLPAWAAKSEAWKDILSVVHLVNSCILVTAIAVHIAAALKHQFVDRDRLLRRMWP